MQAALIPGRRTALCLALAAVILPSPALGLGPAEVQSALGEKLDANRAKEWGLIYDVIPPSALADASFDLARRLAAMPTRALGLIKRGFNASAHNDLEAQLALEVELQREAGSSEDYAEGVRAFVEKRKPRFQGR